MAAPNGRLSGLCWRRGRALPVHQSPDRLTQNSAARPRGTHCHPLRPALLTEAFNTGMAEST